MPARRCSSRRSACCSVVGPIRRWSVPGAVGGAGRGPVRHRRRRDRAGPRDPGRRSLTRLRQRPAGHRGDARRARSRCSSTSMASTRTRDCSTAAAQRAALDRFASVDLEPLRRSRARLTEIDAALAALGGRRPDPGARGRSADVPARRARRGRVRRSGRGRRRSSAGGPARRRGGAPRARRDRARRAAGRRRCTDRVGRAAAGAVGAATVRQPPSNGCGRRRRGRRSRARAALPLPRGSRTIRSAGRRAGSAPAAPRPAAQVRRDARRGHRLPRGGRGAARRAARLRAVRRPARGASGPRRWPRSDGQQPLVGAARRAAADSARRGRRAAPAAPWRCPGRRCAVEVGEDDPGDDVTFLLAANPGSGPLPLAKVASGGELARAMLALRLVLTEAPGDARVRRGRRRDRRRAATAVADALARLGGRTRCCGHPPRAGRRGGRRRRSSSRSTDEQSTIARPRVVPGRRIG